MLHRLLLLTSSSSRSSSVSRASSVTTIRRRHQPATLLKSSPLWSERQFSSHSNSGSGGSGDGRGDDTRGSTPSRGGQAGSRGGGNSRGGWNRNKKYPAAAAGNSNNNNSKDNRNKPNFTRDVLEPAAQGKLQKGHQSGIPRLANRKGKGHAVRRADPLLEGEMEELIGFGNDGFFSEDMDLAGRSGGGGRNRQPKEEAKTGTMAAGSNLEDLNSKEYEEVMEFIQIYQALAYMPDTEEYYWNESDYENISSAEKDAMFQKLKEEATHDADGNLVVEVDDETYNMMQSYAVDEDKGDGKEDTKQSQDRPRGRDNDFNQDVEFIMDTMRIKDFDTPPNPETYDVIKPLGLQGPTVQDFVRSMMQHPTKFGQLRYNSPHPESRREPVPDCPPRRRNPPTEFVEASARFLYVWGLPSLIVNNGPGNLDNPVHAMEIQKLVATLFDIQPEGVFPSTLSSAFVGFSSAADQRFALAVGPKLPLIQSPVVITKYIPKEGDKKSFGDDDMKSVVLVENLPDGHSPASLAATLFPSDLEVGLVFGDLKPDDIVMLTPHSAVLRYDSAEKAENAISSTLVEQRLQEFGQHPIRFSKARRELVYTGEQAGPLGTESRRTLGTQLIVDGDMPKKDFFLSHATALYLRNLDPSITKQDVSDFFQSCCALPRDIEGSVEFVTCHRGLPTGKAYVGFDKYEEAEAAMSLCGTSGRLVGLGLNKVIMKRVREATKVSRQKRSTRKEEDLLDSLDNWEQFVDPEDLEELHKLGISKEALDEALRAIRYHNPTFASMDQAMRTETINPEMETGGMYREMVQTYVSTLKECMSTPDDPGAIYESLFLPDEEIDTEIFEDEPVRQEMLKQRREAP